MRRSALLALGAIGAALPLLAAQPITRHGAALQLRPNPRTTVISGSQTGPVLYVNNAGSSPLNVFGVVGAVSAGPYGIGLVGYGSNPASGNIGVTGLDTGPGGYGTIGYSNYSSGSSATASTQTTGVYGISLYGSGVVGQTQSTQFSTGGILAGVAGIDNTNDSGVNDGVYGKTTSGGYGVEGVSGNGALGGVYGGATSGEGVVGFATTGIAVEARNNSSVNPAMSVSAGGGGDALDVSAGSSLFGLNVTGNSVSDAIYATSSGANAMFGYSSGVDSGALVGESMQPSDSGCTPHCSGGTGVIGITDASTDGAGHYQAGLFGKGTFAILGYPASSAGYSFVGTNASGTIVTSIDASGNINTTGTVSSAGATTAVVPTSHGYFAQSYATQATSRILEDENSGRIVNGAGIVHIDPAFAETVGDGAYEVFLTPKGDSNGLYVTDETPTSFVVRESHGGRSTIAFDYRIVAHPYGHATERMAVAASMSAFQPGASPSQQARASLDSLVAHVAAERNAAATAASRRTALQSGTAKRAAPAQARFSLPPLDLSALTRH